MAYVYGPATARHRPPAPVPWRSVSAMRPLPMPPSREVPTAHPHPYARGTWRPMSINAPVGDVPSVIVTAVSYVPRPSSSPTPFGYIPHTPRGIMSYTPLRTSAANRPPSGMVPPAAIMTPPRRAQFVYVRHTQAAIMSPRRAPCGVAADDRACREPWTLTATERAAIHDEHIAAERRSRSGSRSPTHD